MNKDNQSQVGHIGWSPDFQSEPVKLNLEQIKEEASVKPVAAGTLPDTTVAMVEEIQRLRDELQDWRDCGENAKGDHGWDKVEVHCACVGPLRKMLKDADAVIQEIKHHAENAVGSPDSFYQNLALLHIFSVANKHVEKAAKNDKEADDE